MKVLLTIILLSSHGAENGGMPTYGPVDDDKAMPAQFMTLDSLGECEAMRDAVEAGVSSAMRSMRAYTSCKTIEASPDG